MQKFISQILPPEYYDSHPIGEFYQHLVNEGRLCYDWHDSEFSRTEIGNLTIVSGIGIDIDIFEWKWRSIAFYSQLQRGTDDPGCQNWGRRCQLTCQFTR